jgi:protein gp37
VLTKRAERMREWFKWYALRADADGEPWMPILRAACEHLPSRWVEQIHEDARSRIPDRDELWPLLNVHIGVSVEDQKYADERIPHLLATPAAVRWVSAEPLLGPVDLSAFLPSPHRCEEAHCPFEEERRQRLSWVVVGGESGPGARAYNINWGREVIRQCRDAGVPVFHKQVGSAWTDGFGAGPRLNDRKGGDPLEWPEDLRVREMPGGVR